MKQGNVYLNVLNRSTVTKRLQKNKNNNFKKHLHSIMNKTLLE